jgi:hypothetical protein
LGCTLGLSFSHWSNRALIRPRMGSAGCGNSRACSSGRGCVVWCGVVWCGVVWCGVVWCGVVWCGVVWCGVVVGGVGGGGGECELGPPATTGTLHALLAAQCTHIPSRSAVYAV